MATYLSINVPFVAFVTITGSAIYFMLKKISAKPYFSKRKRPVYLYIKISNEGKST